MMKFNKWLSLLITAVLVCMVGCSSSTNGDAQSPGAGSDQPKDTSSKGKTVINVRISWNELSLPNMKDLVAEFNKSHPDIEVKVEYVTGNTAGIQKLNSEFVAGTAPEIVQMWKKNFNNFVENGLLHDMSDLYKEAGWDKDYFNSGALRWGVPIKEATAQNPKMYGIPDFFQPSVIYYNVGIFKKLDLEEPKNMDELIAVSQKIKAAGIKPMVFNGGDSNSVDLIAKIQAQIAGVQPLLDINEGKAKFTDKPMMDVAKMVERLTKSGVIDAVSAGLDLNAAISVMGSGQAAMMSMNSSLVPNFEKIKQENPGFDYSVFKEFNFVDKPVSKHSVTFGGVWFIPESNKHIKETYEFLKFVFSKENAQKTAKASGRISDVVSANSDITNPVIKKIADNMVGSATVDAFYLIDVVPSQILESLAGGIQEMLNGKIDAETMMKNTQKTMDGLKK